MTRVGGVDLPGEVAAHVAINEVVVHGWDLAAATGHDYAGETELVQAAYAFAPGNQSARGGCAVGADYALPARPLTVMVTSSVSASTLSRKPPLFQIMLPGGPVTVAPP
jgi:hypothetical protein